MRAAVVTPDGQLAVTDRPRANCGPGEIRVRVEACGLCGSDLHAWRRASWSPGLIPGHEIAGRIDEIGPDMPEAVAVRGLEPGRSVVVEPLESCRRCSVCDVGRDSICPELRIAGVHRDGGFAESIVIPAERVHPVDGRLEPTVATLCEPLAVAVHALDRGGLAAGERVLVIGGGTIGILCAFAAHERGAAEVVVRARHPHQRTFAREVAGAVGAEAGPSQSGEGFDLVVETVGGAGDSLSEACAAAAAGGRITIVGLLEPDPAFDPGVALAKELELYWANCYRSAGTEGADFERAIALLESHDTTLGSLITHVTPLEQIEHAFRLSSDKSTGVGKLVVVA